MLRHSLGLIITSSLLTLSACTGMAPDTDTGTATDTGTDPETSGSDTADSVLDLPETPYNYSAVELPAHYLASLERGMDNTPKNNPITDDGATLGRVLFHDTTLSANRTVACASCHAQEHAFADTKKLSTGFDGGLTGRNSMGLTDARYYRNGRFFWDERAATLEDQVLMPIQNAVEMGLTVEELVARVSAESYYPPLFERAFGDEKVTSDRISQALAQYVRSIVSYRSRFDEGMEETGVIHQAFSGFTPQENQGKGLFLGKAGCANCHLDNGPPAGGPPGPTGPRVNNAVFFIDFATNNGLKDVGDDDNGVGDITGNPGDDHRFKSPSLRNVALTAPYMHDGRFATLGQVVEHYNSGVEAQPNLDPRLRLPGSPDPRRLNLTQAEMDALVAFLGTLTDDALLADPRFSTPFVAQKP
jgi:cytochrome c peroxidase